MSLTLAEVNAHAKGNEDLKSGQDEQKETTFLLVNKEVRKTRKMRENQQCVTLMKHFKRFKG